MFLEDSRTKSMDAPSPTPFVACGILGRQMGKYGESRQTLANLDHLCTELETHGDRLMHWAKGAQSDCQDLAAKRDRLQKRLDWTKNEHSK